MCCSSHLARSRSLGRLVSTKAAAYAAPKRKSVLGISMLRSLPVYLWQRPRLTDCLVYKGQEFDQSSVCSHGTCAQTRAQCSFRSSRSYIPFPFPLSCFSLSLPF